MHFCADTIALTRSGVNGELLVLVLHEHINPTQLEMMFRGVGLIILQLLTQHQTFIMRNDVYFLATLRSTTSAERFAYGDAFGDLIVYGDVYWVYVAYGVAYRCILSIW